jgi:hypothetical protein
MSKAIRILAFSAAACVVALGGRAAPVESVESAAARPALQTLESVLAEQIVAEQLKALGLSQQQVLARLSQLSDRQLQELAAQAQLLRAGGKIQSGHPNPLGPLGHIFRQLGNFLTNLYRLLFSWAELK